jgi:hypothetical protein
MTTVSPNISPIEHPKVSPERESIGKKLMFFAWAVEICAVIIGFAISIMQGITSFSEIEANRDNGLGFGDYTNVFIAMMPFFMVAIVEITKIPFVGATYKTSNTKWKIVFGTSLVFLAFITFESALNGFERNFHALIYSIDKHKKELIAVEEEIEPIASQREILANLTASGIEAEYSKRHAIISEERSRQADTIQDRIQGLRAATQTEYIRGLADQIADRRKQVDSQRADRKRELDGLIDASSQMTKNSVSELNTQRRSQQQQLAKAQLYLEELRKKREKLIADAGYFSESGVRERQNIIVAEQEKMVEQLRVTLNQLSDSDRQTNLRARYNADIDAVKDRYQKRIDKLNKEIQGLSLTMNKSLGAREKDVEGVIKNHMKELTRMERKFADQQSDNEKIRETEFNKLAKNEELIANFDKTIFEKKNERVVLRNLVNVKVGDNQVYRMAQWWYSKESAADLDRKDVMVIATLWFGSLAMLIAVTGILLAFASYVIRDPYIDDHVGPRDNVSSLTKKSYNSFRRLVIYWRRVQRRPIIKEVEKVVIKEVPVEKIVRVEIPFEVIRKEIVHIPLYTQDKSLLKLANNNVFDPNDLEDPRANNKGSSEKGAENKTKAQDE